MKESKRGFLPMRHGISLSKEMCPSSPQERERMSQIPYALAIGSIMYAMICTRPDLSYALSMTRRYQANPGEGHWTAVKNILKYLRRTKDVFLVYGGEEELRIKGYTDASFQTDKDDSRSQSGFVLCLNEGTDSIVTTMEPLRKQRNPDLIMDPNILLSVSISYDEMGKYERYTRMITSLIPLTKSLAQQKRDRHTKSLGIRYVSDWS
ncbi:hypothetical protein V6N12_014010 [Hibiscus sabdariffa]|uniref:Retrotransposon protein, putative, Ty1-copia subclass n=1 Tax=Hibiscus sabdariffa TaxID=183260 RepID=A0ABR2CYF8_9ROSI